MCLPDTQSVNLENSPLNNRFPRIPVAFWLALVKPDAVYGQFGCSELWRCVLLTKMDMSENKLAPEAEDDENDAFPQGKDGKSNFLSPKSSDASPLPQPD